MTEHYRFLESPIGPLLLTADDEGRLTGVEMDHGSGPAGPAPGAVRADGELDAAAEQLRRYFAGARRDFDLELAPSGTSFQLAVWEALCAIPYGTTASYGEVAAAVGRPGAARAVGHANARNPIAVVVPCHRVIGASGTLTGFAGGLERKRILLAIEGGGDLGGAGAAAS
ncbi:MAG TPA: methylated-DNA--[protein]-cysteine S-methyltransferase [Acidimicrobiales bacterium]|nr:methylated-DNA--[protein]-cysteine S-methyltransferase [Acidimicrobiales bacterium]